MNEEDDVYLEEPIDQIPWPVLQYQSSLSAVTSAPPLPDKKKKTSGASSEQGSPISSPEDIKKMVCNINSENSSKESSPSTSLERVLKSTESKLLNETPKEEDEAVKNKTSPKSGLSRKSSILKIRSFFEKSHSEPRSDKKSKVSGASMRKASSFRLRDGPRFYRTLDDDHLRSSEDTDKAANESSDDFQVPKLTITQSGAGISIENCMKFSQSFEKETANRFLSHTNAERNTEDKPCLPVKRSKSMKVYRGFDIHTESSEPVVTQNSVEPALVREGIASLTCGVVLSKTPSVTYISSKDKLYPLTMESTAGHARKIAHDYDNSLNCNKSLPLATSSLDRGREQRYTKPSTSLSGTPTCGSLDRGVVSNVDHKVTPTYVNVLVRNQVRHSETTNPYFRS